MTGSMPATIVLSSAKRNVEPRIEQTTKAYYKLLISRGGSSSTVLGSPFGASISSVKAMELFLDILGMSF